jgi:uncharacterized protein YkwD
LPAKSVAGEANPKLASILMMVPVEETYNMSEANTLERLMVDLINEERAAAGVPPLTIDDDLNTSSEMHSTWMLENDVFSHTGEGGSSSNDRIRDAGYVLEGSWATGENIGWQSERGAEGLEDDVRAIHRANILSADYDEVGIGIEQGDFNAATGTFDAVMVTQNFGSTEADDSDDPAEDGGIPSEPEVMVSSEMPPVDDPVVDDPADPAPDDDDEDDPVVAGPGDDDGSEDPIMNPPTEPEPDDHDPVAEGEDTVIMREFVVTTGSSRSTVVETITVGADGTTTSTRTETVAETGDDDGEPFSFDDLDDVFDFGSLDHDDDGEEATVSETEFSFTGPDGTVTTDDPAEFEALLAEFFGEMPEMPETPTCPDALFA